MLTGEEDPTQGNAKLNGYLLEDSHQKFLEQVGYCPQFDAIIDHMTAREMLELFARLRGIPEDNVIDEARKWINFLGIF